MSKNRMDEKSGRNALIYQDKKNGVAATDIAKKYNVSAPRIHRICLKEENKELKIKNLSLEAEICKLKEDLKVCNCKLGKR